MNVYEILQEMAHNFENKIEKEMTLTVQFNIADQKTFWHVSIQGRTVVIHRGVHPSPHIVLDTTADTIQQIYHDTLTGFTAAGKAKISDTAPLDWRLHENLKITPEIQAALYFFIQHFFNTTVPEKVLLGKQYARVVYDIL
jgi:hypothetical protein